MAPTPVVKEPDPDLGFELIPKERYTGREFLELEKERLWPRVWQLAGREAGVPEPGDYFTYEIGDESILVVRQADGRIAAFHNVCQHRGSRLCEPGAGHARAFSCRFHGWTYGADGTLQRVPDRETFAQGIDEHALGLPRVHCDTWGGFVWISTGPDAEPLREYLGIIPEHLDPYHFEEQSLIEDITVEVDCNWKSCIDAFNESYHVHATHPEMLEYGDDVNVQIDVYERHTRFLFRLGVVSPRLRDAERITKPIRELFLRGAGIDPDAFDGSAADVRPAIARAMREKVQAQMGVDFSDLSDDQLIDDYNYTIFPNLALNVHARGFWLFRLRPHPTDPGRMFFDFFNFLRAPGAAIGRPEHVHARQTEFRFAEATLGGEVLDQDLFNLPLVQAGMRSSGYKGLFLGSQELRIRHFHETLERYTGRGEEAEPRRVGRRRKAEEHR